MTSELEGYSACETLAKETTNKKNDRPTQKKKVHKTSSYASSQNSIFLNIRVLPFVIIAENQNCDQRL